MRRIARSEMGQGTLTGLAQMVAEELECDWSKVTTEYPTPGQSLARDRVWGSFSTGGSQGIRGSHLYVRKGGAAAREMLIQAAADAWDVPATECRAVSSVITHLPSGRTTSSSRGSRARWSGSQWKAALLKIRSGAAGGVQAQRLDLSLDGEMIFDHDGLPRPEGDAQIRDPEAETVELQMCRDVAQDACVDLVGAVGGRDGELLPAPAARRDRRRDVGAPHPVHDELGGAVDGRHRRGDRAPAGVELDDGPGALGEGVRRRRSVGAQLVELRAGLQHLPAPIRVARVGRHYVVGGQ